MINELVNLASPFGVTIIALYFMYRITAKKDKIISNIICNKLDEIRDELRDLNNTIRSIFTVDDEVKK